MVIQVHTVEFRFNERGNENNVLSTELSTITGVESIYSNTNSRWNFSRWVVKCNNRLQSEEDAIKTLNHYWNNNEIHSIYSVPRIVIAIAVLFNTLLMNLAERDTELATLRVLGATMSKLGKMMFWEHLGIGIIGGVLGAIFAYFGTVLLIGSQVQWAFYFTIEPQFSSIFTIVGIITAISIALTPIGMWRIKKMDLVDKVKDFSQ